MVRHARRVYGSRTIWIPTHSRSCLAVPVSLPWLRPALRIPGRTMVRVDMMPAGTRICRMQTERVIRVTRLARTRLAHTQLAHTQLAHTRLAHTPLGVRRRITRAG